MKKIITTMTAFLVLLSFKAYDFNFNANQLSIKLVEVNVSIENSGNRIVKK